MRILIIIVSLLLLPGLFVGCYQAHSEASSSPAIATVAGERITTEDFRTGYIDYLLNTGLQDELRYRRHFAETLVAQRLMVLEARDAGIEETERFLDAAERIEKKLLVAAYATEELAAASSVSEEEIQTMFVRANTVLTVRHLYAPTEAGAWALYSRLQDGESFETLAGEVFKDPELARNGGLIGTIKLEDTDAAFEDAAYVLDVGKISEPVRTVHGYSIIKVEDRFTAPLLTESAYAEKRDWVRRYTERRKKAKIQASHVASMLAELNLDFEDDTLVLLADQLTGQGYALLDEDPDDDVLVTFGPAGKRQNWTVGDFRRQARLSSDDQRARVQDAPSLRDFIQGLIAREEMVKRAKEVGIATTTPFQDAAAREERNWIWDSAMNAFLLKAPVPLDSTRAYFDAYSDEFSIPQKIHLAEILVDTHRDAQKVLIELHTRPFAELARIYSRRPGAYESSGELGYVPEDQLGILRAAVLAASEGEVIGPLAVADKFVILKVGDRQPARTMTFEEAQPEIERRLRPQFGREALVGHLATLKKKYPVWVDEALVASLPLKKTTAESPAPLAGE